VAITTNSRLIANLALIINLILLIGALTMFRFSTSPTRDRGIILTIGLGGRKRAHLRTIARRNGSRKSLKVAVKAAYEGFSSIFDANVTTLITAGDLF
jgi:preprotein translocase subunit SecD